MKKSLVALDIAETVFGEVDKFIAFCVKFSPDVANQMLLKSVDISQITWKIKRWLWDTVQWDIVQCRTSDWTDNKFDNEARG